jgi:alpha-D-ribose 1-methylphosphonate 5-triphosphate synthase subunit PhnL
MNKPLLQLKGVAKVFTLHNQNSLKIPVFDHIDLEVSAGECVVLDGPSGMGKSTLLKLIYANYSANAGQILVTRADGSELDVTQATPRELIALRQKTIGYVSQFLRVIPRVSALDIVAESLIEEGMVDRALWESARIQASQWLTRLRIPERLWHLPPATFSGGEQQRVNIARNMIKPRPLLLLDEPTASLDAANTDTVIELIHEARARGAAIVGIFHDVHVGQAVATRHVSVANFREVSP